VQAKATGLNRTYSNLLMLQLGAQIH